MNYNTHIKKDLNMHHTNGNAQTMEKKTFVQIGKFTMYPTWTEKKMNT